LNSTDPGERKSGERPEALSRDGKFLTSASLHISFEDQ
jgi:hypothetical protein